MDPESAQKLLSEAGFNVEQISPCSGGISHHNFDVIINSEGWRQRYIARVEADLGRSSGRRADTIYGGEMSLGREAASCRLVREKAGLPAPEVYGLYHTMPEFLLMEYLPGTHWSTYLQQQNYSLQSYLHSLELLGEDVGKAHRVQFGSFGDVAGSIVLNQTNSFSQRLERIIRRNMEINGPSLADRERRQAETYFQQAWDTLSEMRGYQKPTLVLADVHPTNIFVDAKGKPTGYFDLEFCQAAVPAVEMYNLSLQFYGLFNPEVFPLARGALLSGYNKTAPEPYNPDQPENQLLEQVLTANHLFRAAAVYQQFTTGLRVDWAERFRKLLFYIIDEGKIDYAGFGEIMRSKTSFPVEPTRS